MTGRGTNSSASRARRSFSRRSDGQHPRNSSEGSSGGALGWASPSFLADIDVGRVRMFHPHDVITGIDVVNLAGDTTRQIREKIHRGVAHLLDGYAPPERSIVLVPFEDVAEVADARRRQSLDR